jgi:hypothetical protein
MGSAQFRLELRRRCDGDHAPAHAVPCVPHPGDLHGFAHDGQQFGASNTTTTRTYSVGAQSGYANDIFHVATNGNDTTGSGTLASPWLTIAKAASVVTSGDYVAVHSGYYPEFVDVSRDVATNRIQFIGYGARASGFKVRVSNHTVRGFELDYSVADAANSPQYTYQAADNVHWVDNYVHDTAGWNAWGLCCSDGRSESY